MREGHSAGIDIRQPGRFWAWAACLILGVLILGGVVLALSWQEYGEHRRGAERVEVYSLAVAATASLTDERAPVIELLGGARAPTGLTGPAGERLRTRSDRSIERLESALAARGRGAIDDENLRQARETLSSIRGDVDAIAVLPPDERDPEAIGDVISRLSALVEQLNGATGDVRIVRGGDPALAMDDLATAELAARLRERGGRLRAEVLMADAASATTPGPAVAVARWRTRLAEDVSGIDARIDPAVDDPRVNAAWERLDAAASAAGIGAAPVTATSRGGTGANAGVDDLAGVFAAAEPLREVSLRVGVERAEGHRDAALRWLVLLAALVGVALVAVGVAIALVRRRVVTPLMIARRQIIALADGDVPESVDTPRGDHAVVALFDAVEVLRRSQERRFALERERAALSEQLKVQARTDALTGLLNRHALETVARDLVADGAGEPGVGVIMCDIDRFKVINDRHGHLAGDAVLEEIAARLRRRCDAGELVARFGGEEFVVLVRGGRLDGIASLAEALRVTVAETPVPIGDGVTLDVTASFGVVAGRRDDGWEALVASADAALYEAKQTGRNRVVARRHVEEGDAVPNR